jgi:hypothetical protein
MPCPRMLLPDIHLNQDLSRLFEWAKFQSGCVRANWKGRSRDLGQQQWKERSTRYVNNEGTPLRASRRVYKFIIQQNHSIYSSLSQSRVPQNNSTMLSLGKHGNAMRHQQDCIRRNSEGRKSSLVSIIRKCMQFNWQPEQPRQRRSLQ